MLPMVGRLRAAGRSPSAVSAAIVACLGLAASFGGVVLSGTKTGTAIALAAVLGPVLLALSLFSPMIFPFGLYALLTPFDAILLISSASTVTKIVGAFSAAAVLFFLLRTKRIADPDRSVAVWLVYTLWLMSSVFWAIDVKTSLQLLPTALLLFGLYAVVSLVRVNQATLDAVSRFVMAGGTAAAAYSLYLYHTGVAIKEQRLWLVTDNGLNWNPDHLSAALLLPLALAIVSVVFGRTILQRLLGLACAGVMLPTLVLTGARGPELGLLVIVAYLIIREPNRARLAWPLAIALGLGGLAAAPALISRWSLAASTGGAGRMDIWHVGWHAFKENWLFGAGFNNFSLAYDRSMMTVFQPQYIGWDRASHNIFVGNSVELGIIGLALLLVGWYMQFRALRGIGPDDPRFRMRIVLEASLLGLFVSGFFADVMLTKYLWLAFMMVSLTRNAGPQRVSVPSRTAQAQVQTQSAVQTQGGVQTYA
ncbi:MAG TPA: O-antigen ligase family protein [Candidatus Baltobacteraceae bacterium]|nr:O-antigen ligase family protein [Candidatus Baltobacteraceae bacterium]